MESTTTLDPATHDFITGTVCLRLTICRPGLQKKESTDQLVLDTDKSRYSLSKRILKAESFERIKAVDYEVRRDLGALALPNRFFKQGVYLVPIGCVQRVRELLAAYQPKHAALVNAFVAEYPALVRFEEVASFVAEHPSDTPLTIATAFVASHPDQSLATIEADVIRALEQRDTLRKGFRRSDYPTQADIAQGFEVEHAFFANVTPAALGEISEALFEEEATKARTWWAEARQLAERSLAEGFGGLVEHLADRLQGTDPEGKPKVLRESVVNKLWEFLDSFEDRNAGRNGELAVLVTQTRQLLQGTELDALRTDGDVRSRILTGLQSITASLATAVITQPTRRIVLDEDEPAPELPADAYAPESLTAGA